jgi:hypothetical protein
VGFEPTDELPHHTLSRRAPSATRRLHRSRAYLSWRRARSSQPLEEIPEQREAIIGQDLAYDLDRLA